MHQQLFKDTTSATLTFGMKPKPNNGKLEISPDNCRLFDLLHKAEQKVEAGMVLFAQRGKNRTAQEAPRDGSDDDD